MTPLNIGIDLDGVLANFNDAYADILRTINPAITIPKSSSTWPQHWGWDKHAGYTSKQINEAWEVVKSTTFWGTLHPLKGTLETLKELSVLRGIGHGIYFITSRPGRMAKYYSEIWLGAHGMQNPTVIISNEKGSVAKGLDLNIFIDDKPENIIDVVTAAPKCKCYIINKPYNQTFIDANLCERVNNVQEVLDVLFPELRTLSEVA
jgi:uncharacterized HAD superfamily protein